MMGEAVQQRRGHLRIAEHAGPFPEGQVRGHRDGGSFIELADQVEQQLSAALGYLPIDKIGADLLFQIVSQRYERGATVITTNRVYRKWPEIFNNDATLTSAVLDRLLHHAQTVVIEGKSFRMKDAVQES